jgi:hypothetical protein
MFIRRYWFISRHHNAEQSHKIEKIIKVLEKYENFKYLGRTIIKKK